MTETLSFGDEKRVVEGVPSLGRTTDFGDVKIQIIKEAPFEVHFSAQTDCIAIPVAFQDCEWSPDTDKLIREGTKLGQASFHPAGSRTYARTLERKGELIVLDLPPTLRAELSDAHHIPAFDETRVLQHPLLAPLVTTLHRFASCATASDKLAAEAISTFVLSTLAGAETQPNAKTKETKPFDTQRCLEFIEANLADGVGLDQIAGVSGCSVYHVARLFKSEIGLSPHQYVMERRVARAREMLEAGTSPLADIAYAVGFSSQAHMTDVFRKRLGITPGAYRKEVAK